MALSKRPSGAPLFSTYTDLVAELTEDTGTDPIILDRGANQFLGHQAAHHDGQPNLGPNANRVQAGQLPRTSGPTIGSPTAAQPIGRSDGSLNG